MLHYKHVVLPEVDERIQAGLPLGEGVILDPTPTSKVVEVLTGVYGSVQGSHDRAGHSNARLRQAQARMSCEGNKKKKKRERGTEKQC